MDFCAQFVKASQNCFKLWLNGYNAFISLCFSRICLGLFVLLNISMEKLFLLNYLSDVQEILDFCVRMDA